MMKEYSLDFSGQSGVPSQWGIDLNTVVACFSKQTNGVDGVQLMPDRRRGVFNVTAFTSDAVTALEGFRLSLEKYGKSFEIPLRVKTRKSNTAVWVTIRETCEGPMRDLPNSFFDDIINKYGATIIVSTRRRKFRGTSIYNGQREALVELGANHLSRHHQWTDDQGERHNWFLQYRNQPFHCRRCNEEWHEDGRCPRRVTRQREEKLEGQQKYVFVGTSMLRLATDTQTTRFDAIPGAKIGNIANHISNDAAILPHAEVLVVVAGQNMGGDSIGAVKQAAASQAKELAKVMEPYHADKKLFVVDPSAGPGLEGERGDETRFLRAEMRRCAERAGAAYISLESLIFDDDDIHADGVHFSGSGTNKFLAAIRDHIHSSIGVDILGDFSVSAQPYSAIKRNHYKVGCSRCTFMHLGTTCPPLEATGDEVTAEEAVVTNAEVVVSADPVSSAEAIVNSIISDCNATPSSSKKKKKKKNQQSVPQLRLNDISPPEDMVQVSPGRQPTEERLLGASPDLAASAAAASAAATPSSSLHLDVTPFLTPAATASSTPSSAASASTAPSSTAPSSAAAALAAATAAAQRSMAAVVASKPAVVLPVDPRSRSTSQKRNHDGVSDRSRSESAKRVRSLQEVEIARNAKSLLELGCTIKRQKELFAGLSGNELILKQLEYMKRAVTLNPSLGKKGGK